MRDDTERSSVSQGNCFSHMLCKHVLAITYDFVRLALFGHCSDTKKRLRTPKGRANCCAAGYTERKGMIAPNTQPWTCAFIREGATRTHVDDDETR